MNGLAQYSVWKGKSSRKVDQSRRGGLDTKEEESPGEELRREIRNAIRTELSDENAECSGAKNHREPESPESRRDCCAGRVVNKESEGVQAEVIAPASAEEPRE